MTRTPRSGAFFPSRIRHARLAVLFAWASAYPGIAPAQAREHLGLTPPAGATFPPIHVNDNRIAAGRLENGVLTLRLEVRAGTWFPEDDEGPGVGVYAFAEEGGALLNPGPLIRVPQGTVIAATIRNALVGDTITVSGLGDRPGRGGDGAEVFRVAPGGVHAVRFTAGAAGTYFYAAQTTGARALTFRSGHDSQLNGLLLVDPPNVEGPPRDRAFLISWWNESRAAGASAGAPTRHTMVINGRPWPKTERFEPTVGDTLRWRWVNVTEMHHPMHLHGFYYTVESGGEQTRDSVYAPG
ncbi:MAG TPA: multicopper oxidase domain-containing protein, partial [Gemmatimonadaceae bacterium]|nr:multicopper oxidase domain-containing protein [Gemmatimonadaceae bacterium]